VKRIGKPATAAGDGPSSIPSCSSIPAGWTGEWVQMAGSTSGPGYSISETVPPGTWVLVYCNAGQGPVNLGDPGPGNAGNTGAG
jgi:hypothetical protein